MAYRWVTADEVISQRPVLLKGLVITPSGSEGEVKIYDGESTKDPLILTVMMVSQDTKSINLAGGLETRRGLYIGSFSHMTGVLVIWEEL